RRTAEVQLRNNQLFVGGKRFLLRGIRYTGSPPLRTLRDAGINTVWLDESTTPGLIEEAANRGFWIVPTIVSPRSGSLDAHLASTNEFARKVSRFLEQDAVLAWDLGSNLGAERFTDVSKLARNFRSTDPNRPVMADVWDGYRGYSRGVDQVLLRTHRWPLMPSLDLPAYRQWLLMRRRLAADGYCWTWIQTHLPDWFVEMNQEGPKSGITTVSLTAPKELPDPIGPQPEQ